MSLSNEFATSQLITQYTASYFGLRSWVLKYADIGVSEFQQDASNPTNIYKTGGAIRIEIMGYPSGQRGKVITPEARQTKTVNYVIDPDVDIYNTGEFSDAYEILYFIKGHDKAFRELSQKILADKGYDEIDPDMKNKMNRFAQSSFDVLKDQLERTVAERFVKNAYYCPISDPNQMPTQMTVQYMNDTHSFMNSLGMYGRRFAVLNEKNYNEVVNTFNNQFNNRFSFPALVDNKWPEANTLKGFVVMDVNTILSVNNSPQYTQEPTDKPTVTGLSADGRTLSLSGVISTNGLVFNEGTLLTLESVKYVTGIAKAPTFYTAVFKVTADADGNGDGTVDVQISDAIDATSQHANVNITPAIGSLVTVWPGYLPNNIFLPRGLYANALPLDDVYGSTIGRYTTADRKIMLQTYAQGNVLSLINNFRMSMLNPLLVVPDGCVLMPTQLPDNV